MIVITDGPNGSYCYNNGNIEYNPTIDVKVKNTAGAGDAFLAGVIIGLCCSLPFLKVKNNKYFSKTPINSASELGTILASCSVMSTDTINHEINANYIREFIIKQNINLSKAFKKIL